MKDDLRGVLLGAVAGACAFVLFRGATDTRRRAPEDAVPDGSFLVATIDVDALRRSPVTQPLLASGAGRALAGARLEEACGFDPLSRVRAAAIAVPEEATERGTFGLAARVDVTAAELQRCSEGLSRGGAQPSTRVRDVGAFHVLTREGRDEPAIAYDGDGLLLVGKGPWLDAMIASASAGPRSGTSTEHRRLRASLAREPAMRSPAVLVTLVLPAALRVRLKTEMAAELGGDASGMAGVLGVSSLGVALVLPRAEGHVSARAELVCDDETSATELDALVVRKRDDARSSFALRMLGASALLDAVTTRRDGRTLHVAADAEADVVAKTLARIGGLGGRPPPAP